jgi:hypothetical protein
MYRRDTVTGYQLFETTLISGSIFTVLSRRLRAIPRDNLPGQIDEGAQARGHVAASWIVEAISGI